MSTVWRSFTGRHTLDLTDAVYYADIPFIKTPIGEVSITPITRQQWRHVALLYDKRAFETDPPVATNQPPFPIPENWTKTLVNQAHEEQLPATDIPLMFVDSFISILHRETGITFRLPTSDEAFAMATHDFIEAGEPIPRDLDKLGAFAWQPFQPPVGTSRRSSWGLYDTFGCVWQWCNDGPPPAVIILPNGDAINYPLRYITGGSWRYRARDVVPHFLGGFGMFTVGSNAKISGKDIGFRLIRETEN